MAIERISELDTASFEKQLWQKCAKYKFADLAAFSYSSTGNPESIRRDDSSSTTSDIRPSGGIDQRYWRELNNTTGDNADVTYCIQEQIVYNADALLGLITTNSTTISEDTTGRYSTNDILFWYDGEKDDSLNEIRPGYMNNAQGRIDSATDPIFRNNGSFNDDRRSTGDEDTENLFNVPKTHAAKSYIEISEYAEGDPKAKNSYYFSRKLSLLWLFNAIKAIADLKCRFVRLICGTDVKNEHCLHDEAEGEEAYDKSNQELGSSDYSPHNFIRSNNPAVNGRLDVYGNAQFNGKVSTFHSQVRFHDQVRVWDSLEVFGQSYFSKDINGTAMRVRWGDIAEEYCGDSSYPPGTLVKFGGKEEITLADDVANAVVTTNPGVLLNDGRASRPIHPVSIALAGRVPVRVWGDVRKFDLLVPDVEHRGNARAMREGETIKPIARALESNENGKNMVVCATQFSL